MTDSKDPVSTNAAWHWLFPATYLLHVAEEYWVGGGYSAHLARTQGVVLSPSRFLWLNLLGVGLMAVGIMLARRLRFPDWMLSCLAVVFIVNALSHLAGSVTTGGYDPGVITGVLIWIPLGAATLYYLKKRMRWGRLLTAAAAGLAIQAVVSLLAQSGGRL
ncbi:MAG: HXXEE domain-containing protein [Pyrinomonadaceae bacterium]